MKDFFNESAMLNHPLRALTEFLKREESNYVAKNYDKLRLVGYALEMGYDSVTIITSDPYKIAVGGIPRNSLLIMVPSNHEELPPHFTLLRVLDAAPTPLSHEVQQTYFELQKKSMPELDVFTQSELQWGALKTSVLGMFYPCPDKGSFNDVEFSGDVNNYVSAHKYTIYAPDKELLDLITNSMVPLENRFPIGKLRMTESRMALPEKPQLDAPVWVCTRDFMGNRTAMFGKTRLGKSNVVKLIAQSLIETTKETKDVGQLIFDINGEYANDNPQDNDSSIRSAYKDRCEVYALTQKESTPSRPLKLDFYETPQSSHRIIESLLKEQGKNTSNYITSFLSVDIPSIDSVNEMDRSEQLRAKRKILMYWAVLHSAGFRAENLKLRELLGFDPKLNKEARKIIYSVDSENELPTVNSLDALLEEFSRCAEAVRRNGPLKSSTGKDLFDADDKAILNFLVPSGRTSSGPRLIQQFRKYHDPSAGDFVTEIIEGLDQGKTIILDLGNAPPEVTDYFSTYLTNKVFNNQVEKFSNNNLGKKYLQIYFEEAHELFPTKETDEVDIYRRLAKEGAKYHIGMVYSTQSPTTINKDLLAQTENFFVAHLSSQDEVDALARVNVAYGSLKHDILQTKTVGYIRMLSRSHRFVIPVQVRKFEATSSESMNGEGSNAV